MGHEIYPGIQVVKGEPVETTPKQFSFGNLEDLVYQNGNTFCLDSDLAASINVGLEPGNAMIESTNFRLRPDWALGREDSGYGVYFGELDVLTTEGKEHSLPVAAKHFPLFERDRAIHEFAATQMFKDTEDLRTFTPLGIWVNNNGEAVLLTHFEEPVVSLDNLDWDKAAADSVMEHLDIIEGLQRSAQILARLHSRGFAHNDAQIKNMAVHQDTGAIRLTDLTALERVYDPEDGDLNKWQQMVYKDLSDLINSIRRAGLLRGDKPEDTRRLVDVALLSIHASMLRHPSTRFIMKQSVASTIDQVDQDLLDAVA